MTSPLEQQQQDREGQGASVHTPGPWVVRVDGLFHRIAHGEHRTTVANGILAETNAHLIAAAPDMLRVLEQVAEGFGPHSDVLEVIAKARGRSA